MEERYARLVLEYTTIEEKGHIYDVIEKLIVDMRISPNIIITPIEPGFGEYTIEFHDDYDKEGGEFFERLLRELNIEACD
jgi:hypothetical protein